MGDIADLVGLTYVLIARNGANGELTARIRADTDREKGYGAAGLLPHYSKTYN